VITCDHNHELDSVNCPTKTPVQMMHFNYTIHTLTQTAPVLMA